MSQADKDTHLESILKRYKPDNLSKLPLDIQYLMGDEINLVLSEGFNVLYRTQPHHPIDFFAKWLLNYEATQKNKQTVHHNDTVLKDTIKKYDEAAEVRRKQEAEVEAQRKLHEKHENQFRDKLKAHDYHEELLNNDLPSFIEKQKGLPAVYIGVLEHPSRAIADDEEDEFAHLETSYPKVITYIGASGSQKFLVGRELPLGKGVTYSVFEAKPVPPAAEEGQETVVPVQPKYLYISDVTTEPRIFYFRIPKLGAYMACPMSYNSVLSEKAFDAGVAERERAQDEQKKQDKEKEERDADYEQRIKEAQEAELGTQEIEDEWKGYEWPKIVEGEFLSEEKKFVVCVDTLGEDREITQLERDYVSELIQTFVNNWEESEKRQLSKDVDLYLQIQAEVNREEFLEDLETRLNEFLTKVEEPPEAEPVEGEEAQAQAQAQAQVQAQEKKPEEEEEESEEKQNYKKAVKTTEFYKKVLLEDKVKNMVKALSGYRVIKFKALIQNIMYFLGYKKGQVNIPGTNILDWKEIKKTISKDDFFRRLEEYEYKGPKEGYWERYALTHKLAQKLDKFKDEDLEEYNLGLAVLFRYVKQVISTRLLDIELRKNQKAEERAAREELLQKELEWHTTRDTELEQARAKAVEEEQELNEEEWVANWIEEHPAIEIPAEVIDDIDEDILEQD